MNNGTNGLSILQKLDMQCDCSHHETFGSVLTAVDEECRSIVYIT